MSSISAQVLLARRFLAEERAWLAFPIGITAAVLLTVAFVVCQRWRFSLLDRETNEV